MKEGIFIFGDIILAGLFIAAMILLDKKEREEKHKQ